MKVVLINPYTPINRALTIIHPPLGFGYIINQLNKFDHNIKYIDLVWESDFEVALNKCIKEFEDSIILITSVSQTYHIALKIAKYIKNMVEKCNIILGGPHVTFTAKETLTKHRYIDFVSLYEGEFTICELANYFSKHMYNDRENIQGISNIAYLNGDVYIQTKNSSPIENLDVLGIPNRQILGIEKYLENDYETVIMTARGCPNKCSFCSTTAMGRKYRLHSVDHVIAEIKEVIKLGFSSVFFGDDTFPANRDRTFEICDRILSEGLNISWTCNMRVIDVEEKLIKKMKDAGMYRTFIGFESFDNDELTMMKKNCNVTMQKKAAEILMREGVELHASMIIGGANQTKERIYRSVDFLKKEIKPTIVTFNTIELRPGTEMYNNPKKYGYHLHDLHWYEKEKCFEDIHVSTNFLKSFEIRNLCYEAYEKFYTE